MLLGSYDFQDASPVRLGVPDFSPYEAPRMKKKRNIFDGIGDALSEPGVRAALLRSGAATLASGSVGEGILTGASWFDRLRDQQAEEAQYQQRRQDGFEDWRRREEWERENPKQSAPTPTEMQRNYEYLRSLDPEQADTYLRNQVDPIKAVTAGEGGVEFYRAGGGPAGGQPSQRSGAPPVGAIKGGHRFKGGDHRDPQNWEPIGGASPGGSHTFR